MSAAPQPAVAPGTRERTAGTSGRGAAIIDHHPHRTVELLVCARCKSPVRRNAASFKVFEQMHWVCFRYEFKYGLGEGDPDEACADRSCPARVFDPSPPPRFLDKPEG